MTATAHRQHGGNALKKVSRFSTGIERAAFMTMLSWVSVRPIMRRMLRPMKVTVDGVPGLDFIPNKHEPNGPGQ
jgi:hypothetical protein